MQEKEEIIFDIILLGMLALFLIIVICCEKDYKKYEYHKTDFMKGLGVLR